MSLIFISFLFKITVWNKQSNSTSGPRTLIITEAVGVYKGTLRLDDIPPSFVLPGIVALKCLCLESDSNLLLSRLCVSQLWNPPWLHFSITMMGLSCCHANSLKQEQMQNSLEADVYLVSHRGVFNGAFPLHGTARYGTVHFWGVFHWVLYLVPDTFYGAFPLHGTVRFGTARYGTVRLSSGRFAFPLQFSTAIEWAGLFTRRYNCAASTAVTSS